MTAAAKPPIETLHSEKFLALRRQGHWEYAERINSTGACFILAVTPAQEIVLVEQYRIPLQARCIELPAGLIGDEDGGDETAVQSALRELEEETGFRGRSARVVLHGPVAPGLTSERLTLVRVTGLKRVHAGGGVAGEDITVHVVSLAKVDAWLRRRARAGLLVEPRIYTALYLLGRRRRG